MVNPVQPEMEHAADDRSGKGPTSPSAGQCLRQLREAAGLNVQQLAAGLKISRAQLEDLEADRLDQLPSLAFSRSLAASICRSFGADPQQVLKLMPVLSDRVQTLQSGMDKSPAIRAGQQRLQLRQSSSGSRFLFALACILILASLVLWLWPRISAYLGQADLPLQQSGADESAVILPQPGEAANNRSPDAGNFDASADLPPKRVTENLPQQDATVLSDADARLAPAPDLLRSGEQGDEGSHKETAELLSADDGQVETPAAAPADERQAEAAEPADAPAFLILTAQAESWVAVTDAEGKRLVYRNLQPGEVVSLDDGPRPFKLTIARKGAVDVQVKGKAFDHRTLSSGSISRFQVP